MDTVQIDAQNQLRAVIIPVGQTKTIAVDLLSQAPTSAPFDVAAVDVALAKGQPQELSVTLDRSSGKNGDKLNLTIKPLVANPNGFSAFVVQASMGATTGSLWYGTVITAQ